MNRDFTGKTAVITGGAGGIGSAMVRKFAACGADVYIIDINDESGNALEKELKEAGKNVRYIHCSVYKADEVNSAVEAVVKEKGKIDFLLNNAGANIALDKRGKIRKYSDAGWNFTVDVCMDGVYHFTKCVLPHMIKNGGGKIINTGSVTGMRMGLRNQCAYNMAKAAIHNMSRATAAKYAKYNITVNCVIPGTTWHENFYKSLCGDQDKLKQFLSHVPISKPNTPEDMANAAAWLCSEEADRVTGLLMNIDGGWAASYCK